MSVVGSGHRSIRAVAALLASSAALGCTSFADGDDVLDMERARNEPGAADTGSDWSCLSGVLGVDSSQIPTDQSSPLAFTLRVLAAGGRAPAGLEMRACSGLDPMCMEPVTDWLPASEAGTVVFDLFQGFVGFIEARSDDTLSVAFFLPGRLLQDAEGPTINAVSEPGLRALAAASGFEVAPTAGTMVVVVQDCADARASGVVLQNDKGGIPFYYLSGIPTAAATATTADGVGGFLNVQAGSVVARARVAEDGREIGATSLYVRPQWITVGMIAAPIIPTSSVR
jgi:hypothetical protein